MEKDYEALMKTEERTPRELSSFDPRFIMAKTQDREKTMQKVRILEDEIQELSTSSNSETMKVRFHSPPSFMGRSGKRKRTRLEKAQRIEFDKKNGERLSGVNEDGRKNHKRTEANVSSFDPRFIMAKTQDREKTMQKVRILEDEIQELSTSSNSETMKVSSFDPRFIMAKTQDREKTMQKVRILEDEIQELSTSSNSETMKVRFHSPPSFMGRSGKRKRTRLEKAQRIEFDKKNGERLSGVNEDGRKNHKRTEANISSFDPRFIMAKTQDREKTMQKVRILEDEIQELSTSSNSETMKVSSFDPRFIMEKTQDIEKTTQKVRILEDEIQELSTSPNSETMKVRYHSPPSFMGRSGKRKRTRLEKAQRIEFDKKMEKDYEALMKTEERTPRELSFDPRFIMAKTQDREKTMQKVRILEDEIQELSTSSNSETMKVRFHSPPSFMGRSGKRKRTRLEKAQRIEFDKKNGERLSGVNEDGRKNHKRTEANISSFDPRFIMEKTQDIEKTTQKVRILEDEIQELSTSPNSETMKVRYHSPPSFMGRSGKRKRTRLEKAQRIEFDKKMEKDYEALMKTEERTPRELSFDPRFIMAKTQDREKTMQKVRILEDEIQELSTSSNSETMKVRFHSPPSFMGRSGKRKRTRLEKAQRIEFDKKNGERLSGVNEDGRKNHKRTEANISSFDPRFIMEKTQDIEKTMQKVRILEDEIQELSTSPNSETMKVSFDPRFIMAKTQDREKTMQKVRILEDEIQELSTSSNSETMKVSFDPRFIMEKTQDIEKTMQKVRILEDEIQELSTSPNSETMKVSSFDPRFIMAKTQDREKTMQKVQESTSSNSETMKVRYHSPPSFMGRSGKKKRTRLEEAQRIEFDKKMEKDYEALMKTEERTTRELSSFDPRFIMEKTQDREKTMQKVRILEDEIQELSTSPN
ncbi:uncharacterized protein LOC127094214 [Lathyrus oleraceus]|uniref:uncharacterized protein LOC127094214 n=1 Tax=Pisum sativum TaxID=3888 RepID=UPI0021D10350|nr:uncharacterized protein LOC127094214 [Pisum sativum]